jgi:hypothetical protein
MQLAQMFKIPVRQVREILGKRPPKPPFPGVPEGCVHEADGYCIGRVFWHWVDEAWQARCDTHHPGWERWSEHPEYQAMVEKNVREKRGMKP